MEEAMPLRDPNSMIFPDELILEIFSWLPVKTLFRLRCLNKFFNTLTFNPHFVQIHLNKSSQNPRLALMCRQDDIYSDVATLSISRLLRNRFNILHHELKDNNDDCRWWVGSSCNGVLCLIDRSSSFKDPCMCFLNPATRIKSEKFTIFTEPSNNCLRNYNRFKISLGFDGSTGTYKVVAFYVEFNHNGDAISVVSVFSLGDNSWRKIQSFPVLPFYWFDGYKNNGLHLSGTINWLALHGGFSLTHSSINSTTADQFVIVSLDLSTETYTQFLLPEGFDEVPHVPPTLTVLMDRLCFCHDFKETHFVIWQMNDFGVQESWTQLSKISYQNFDSLKFQKKELLPLYLSKNGDSLIFANDKNDPAIIYNCRDSRVEGIRVIDKISWLWAKDYVESLISPI